MKISIIIRTKNEENWLKACLSQIKKQEYKNYEIIIVDNASTDRTIDVAKFHGVKKIVDISDYLPGKALHLGVQSASGDILVFLSAHCVPYSNSWLQELITPVISGESVAAYGRQIPTSASNPDDARDLFQSFGSEKVIQQSDGKFHNANSCIRSSYYSKYPFDISITNVEDWYWGTEVVKRGDTISYCPEAVVYHNHGLNQHKNIESFRAKPVYQLLKNLIGKPGECFFHSPSFWKGLIIVSLCDPNKNTIIKEITNVIDEAETIHCDIIVTGSISSFSKTEVDFLVSDDWSFQKYLVNALNFGEKINSEIYDYVIFIDQHYQYIDYQLIEINAKSLFSNWTDVASVYRELKGWVFRQDKVVSNISEKRLNKEEKLIETYIGQCGAIRTSVLRRNLVETSEISLSKVIDRKYSFKNKIDENI